MLGRKEECSFKMRIYVLCQDEKILCFGEDENLRVVSGYEDR